MRPLGMVWIVALLYFLGLVLPALGFVFFFRDYNAGRKRQMKSARILAEVKAARRRRAEELKSKLKATTGMMARRELNRDIEDLDDWGNKEARSRGARWATYESVQRLMNDSYFGTVSSQLRIAKRDVALVGGGILSATVASIWSLWL